MTHHRVASASVPRHRSNGDTAPETRYSRSRFAEMGQDLTEVLHSAETRWALGYCGTTAPHLRHWSPGCQSMVSMTSPHTWHGKDQIGARVGMKRSPLLPEIYTIS